MTARTGKARRAPRWRAATLALVYLLMALHFLHWKLAGATLAPLELNEVMYTLELGIVTAGFLFMAIAVLSVAVFGRFFCSWGCHVLALQDLSAWLLRKIRIRPRPVRSHVLQLVPLVAMIYMFVWPQVSRLLSGGSLPPLRILGDGEGWASFVTSDFTRNLPGPGVTLLTFAVCGFLAVYVLGSRAFCTYACPYGIVFGVADRIAPGRIAAIGDCSRCGACTAVCQSRVRVEDEIVRFGRVVSTSCLKDLDCVRVCPPQILSYRFTRPSLLRSIERAAGRARSDFTPAEEILMGAVFVATLLAFRGLYNLVPFLLTLALGGILGYWAVLGLRLVRQEEVHWSRRPLKLAGKLTGSGRAFAGLSIGAALLFAHSAFIRFHEHLGQRAVAACVAEAGQTGAAGGRSLERALFHLERCLHWGLFRPVGLDRKLARVHALRGSPELAESSLRRVLAREPEDLDSRLHLAKALFSQERAAAAVSELERLIALAPPAEREGPHVRLARACAHEMLADAAAMQGDREKASAEYRAAIADDADRDLAHLNLGLLLADGGSLAEGTRHVEEAVRLRPDSALARYNLAVCLAAAGSVSEAAEQYRASIALDPAQADAHNNLGLVLAAQGDLDAAASHFERALSLEPGLASAHFNLGRVLEERGLREEAARRFETAARLDPAYRTVLRARLAQPPARAREE